MPHLVLPLSGCLSRRTPTRATRGEAKGHRSVFAQNSLLMCPPSFFLPLDFSSVWCDIARWWTSPHCLCAAVGTFLSGVVRSRCFVDMWTAEGHTARLLGLCVCVVCSSPRGVGVDRRRACPHRRDVGALMYSRCQWCRDLLGYNDPARLCVAIAVVGPPMVTPDDRGGLGG